jgi:hypothetical protein
VWVRRPRAVGRRGGAQRLMPTRAPARTYTHTFLTASACSSGWNGACLIRSRVYLDSSALSLTHEGDLTRHQLPTHTHLTSVLPGGEGLGERGERKRERERERERENNAAWFSASAATGGSGCGADDEGDEVVEAFVCIYVSSYDICNTGAFLPYISGMCSEYWSVPALYFRYVF